MAPALACNTISVSDLGRADIESMFRVFSENFDGAHPEIFERDLRNKNWVILLRDTSSRELQGFSTIALFETQFHNLPISVVYSGDTIIRREYWGTPELPHAWIHTVLEKSAAMQPPVYWLLISSGYKTYRFLSVFYKTFYPHFACATPPEMQALMDHLARERYGDDYRAQLGVVRFKVGATPLKHGLAEITNERLHDPHVAFYLEKNPRYDQGDELVCITRVHAENFTVAGRRMAR